MSLFPSFKKPDGRFAESIAVQRLSEHASVQSVQGYVSGVRVNRTTRGNFVVPDLGAGGGGGGTRIDPYVLRDVWGDYLVARSISWRLVAEELIETIGTTDVFIAKEYKHRNSLEAETILGEDHTYTYSAGPSETWAAGASTEYNITRVDAGEQQRIIPPWTEDEIIYACRARTDVFTDFAEHGGVAVNLLIVGRSCQWAKIYV